MAGQTPEDPRDPTVVDFAEYAKLVGETWSHTDSNHPLGSPVDDKTLEQCYRALSDINVLKGKRRLVVTKRTGADEPAIYLGFRPNSLVVTSDEINQTDMALQSAHSDYYPPTLEELERYLTVSNIVGGMLSTYEVKPEVTSQVVIDGELYNPDGDVGEMLGLWRTSGAIAIRAADVRDLPCGDVDEFYEYLGHSVERYVDGVRHWADFGNVLSEFAGQNVTPEDVRLDALNIHPQAIGLCFPDQNEIGLLANLREIRSQVGR